jgi:CubicO group peptidase (beta-lactamase class C family)
MLHTSGFPNAAIPRTASRDERRAAFARWQLEWEPGSRFEYHATSAHWVLADIVERVTGRDFRDELHDRVTAPLRLPRLLGAPIDGVVDCARVGAPPEGFDNVSSQNDPAVRATGVPGGGGLATAATVALWYQAVLQNRLWDDTVWHDVVTNVRCTLPDPLMGVPANRSLGLVLAGDDGLHQFRYAAFGRTNSPRAFGHAGAYMQIAWADPASGVSFAFCKNGCNEDQIGDAGRVLPLSDLAAQL